MTQPASGPWVMVVRTQWVILVRSDRRSVRTRGESKRSIAETPKIRRVEPADSCPPDAPPCERAIDREVPESGPNRLQFPGSLFPLAAFRPRYSPPQIQGLGWGDDLVP